MSGSGVRVGLAHLAAPPQRLAPGNRFPRRAEVARCHPPTAVETTAATTPEDTLRTRPLKVQHRMQHSRSTSDKMLSHLGITPKIAPAYDGTTSWFEYAQWIDDWCDITTLDEDKRGPSLKTRLSGIAAVQKH